MTSCAVFQISWLGWQSRLAWRSRPENQNGLTRTVSLWEHPWRDRQTGARDAGRLAATQTCTTINVRQMVFQQAVLAGEAAAAVG
jgi:hypothetical protein